MARVFAACFLSAFLLALALAAGHLIDYGGTASASHGTPLTAMSIDTNPYNYPESGAECTNSADDDGDGFVNDGCPLVGLGGDDCATPFDDNGDTVTNDGCPSVGNSVQSVDSREVCARINENNLLDADEDATDTKHIDVTVEGIPPYHAGVPAYGGLAGFTYRLNYDEANLTLQAADSAGWKISQGGGAVPMDASQPTPDVNGDNSWFADVDYGTLADGDGVLTRISISTDAGATSGQYPLTLTNNAIRHAVIGFFGPSLTPTATNNAFIAVNQGCDSDLDGIEDALDPQPNLYTDFFTDFPTGSPTFGTITDRNGLTVAVTIAPGAPQRVRIAASGAGGPATVQVCNQPQVTLTLAAGNTVDVRCTSATVTVLSGPVEATFAGHTLTLPAGTTVTISLASEGVYQVAADPGNLADILLDGQSVAPGEEVLVAGPPGPPAVGGVAGLISEPSDSPVPQGRGSAPQLRYAALAVATGVIALSAGGWYARKQRTH